MWSTTCTCARDRPEQLRVAQEIRPGFYWALWLTAANGTHEGDELTPSHDWEVVEVWENFIGDRCEADAAEKFGVSVPGVRESQWLENFKWGERVKDKA
jgi:hypothetical protein